MTGAEGNRLDQIKGKAEAAFERANPEFWKRVQGNPSLAEKAKNIHDRQRSISLRMETHIYKHRQKWMAREAVKVLEERERPDFNHPRPSWAFGQPGNVSYLEEARRRVQSRIQGRMQRINTAAERMIQDQEDRQRVPDLQSKVHMIVARTQAVRTKATRHFNRYHQNWISRERYQGSINPARDVFARHQKRSERINQAERTLIQQTFKEHGKPLPVRQERAFVQDFDQTMG